MYILFSECDQDGLFSKEFFPLCIRNNLDIGSIKDKHPKE